MKKNYNEASMVRSFAQKKEIRIIFYNCVQKFDKCWKWIEENL